MNFRQRMVRLAEEVLLTLKETDMSELLRISREAREKREREGKQSGENLPPPRTGSTARGTTWKSIMRSPVGDAEYRKVRAKQAQDERDKALERQLQRDAESGLRSEAKEIKPRIKASDMLIPALADRLNTNKLIKYSIKTDPEFAYRLLHGKQSQYGDPEYADLRELIRTRNNRGAYAVQRKPERVTKNISKLKDLRK